MDLSTFRIRFPEFGLAEDEYVQAFLDAAEARLDEDVWGDLLGEGVGWLAAHLMAVTPAGVTAGMSRNSESRYGIEYNRLCRDVAGGPQVI